MTTAISHRYDGGGDDGGCWNDDGYRYRGVMVMVMVVMVVMLIVGPIDDQNYGNDGYYNHLVIYNLHQ